MEQSNTNIPAINGTSVFSGTKRTADDAELDLTPDEEEAFFGFLQLECEKDVECDGSEAVEEDIDVSFLLQQFDDNGYASDAFNFDLTVFETEETSTFLAPFEHVATEVPSKVPSVSVSLSVPVVQSSFVVPMVAPVTLDIPVSHSYLVVPVVEPVIRPRSPEMLRYFDTQPRVSKIKAPANSRNTTFNHKVNPQKFIPFFGATCDMQPTCFVTPIPKQLRERWEECRMYNMCPKKRQQKPSNRCIYCQMNKYGCSSFPGNGRCLCCRMAGLPCEFTEKWYDYCEKNPHNEYYFYVFPDRM